MLPPDSGATAWIVHTATIILYVVRPANGLQESAACRPYELRPEATETARPAALVQPVVDIFTGRTHIMVDVTAEDDPSLSTDTKGARYHITQAALNNVAKHSTAGRVPIMLQEAGPRYAFRIQGDGWGSERGS